MNVNNVLNGTIGTFQVLLLFNVVLTMNVEYVNSN